MTTQELIQESNKVFNTFNKVSILTEFHNGQCWYTVDNVEFKNKFNAQSYINKIDLDGNTIVHIYNNN